MSYDLPSNKSSNWLSRYGFWLIIVCAVLIVTGALNYGNTNHDPAAVTAAAPPAEPFAAPPAVER